MNWAYKKVELGWIGLVRNVSRKWVSTTVNITFDLLQISCVELSRSKEKNYVLEVWLEMRTENMEIEFKKLKIQAQIYSFRSLTKSKKIPFYQKPKIP